MLEEHKLNKRYFGLQNNKRDECTRSASLNVVRNRLVIELDLMETRYVLFVGFTNKKTFSSISTSILSFIHSKIQAVPHFWCDYLNINVILYCTIQIIFIQIYHSSYLNIYSQVPILYLVILNQCTVQKRVLIHRNDYTSTHSFDFD